VAGQKDRVRELESELEEALASIQRLRDENDHLRARLLNGRTESTRHQLVT